MQNIITIQEGVFPDTAVPTVNARDLHAFLEVGKDFSNWIKDRIQQHEFVENQDFIILAKFGEYSGRGQPKKEYALTLDAAKHIAMSEHTPKGREARQYFIACEKKYRQISSGEAPYSGDPRFARFANANWPAVARMHAAYKRVARTRKIPFADQAGFADRAVETMTGIPLPAIVEDVLASMGHSSKKASGAESTTGPQAGDTFVKLDAIQAFETDLLPDAKLLPSDLGALLGGYTGSRCNQLLYGLGYQEPHRVRGKLEWQPTEKGAPFAIREYVPRANGRGSDVPQLLWKAGILDALRQEPKLQANLALGRPRLDS